MTDLVERCAKSPEGLAARVIGRHATLHELLDAARDQGLELVVELSTDPLEAVWAEAEEASHAGPQLEQHARPPSPPEWPAARRSDRPDGAILRGGGIYPER